MGQRDKDRERRSDGDLLSWDEEASREHWWFDVSEGQVPVRGPDEGTRRSAWRESY